MQPSTCNWLSHCAGLSNLTVFIMNCDVANRFTCVSSINTVSAPFNRYVSSVLGVYRWLWIAQLQATRNDCVVEELPGRIGLLKMVDEFHMHVGQTE